MLETVAIIIGVLLALLIIGWIIAMVLGFKMVNETSKSFQDDDFFENH